MSNRLHKSWTVLQSLESIEGDRCVDIFERPDQSFGFEEFRRDAEDMGHWTAVSYYSSLNFNSKEVTLRQARRYVPWLAAL
ncbi:MAG: hypothetical protein WA888_20420 [Burkholderiaceae bacterium]